MINQEIIKILSRQFAKIILFTNALEFSSSHNENSIWKCFRFFHSMRCKNNCFRLLKTFYHFPYFSSCFRIHSWCRFIQEYYRWITYFKHKMMLIIHTIKVVSLFVTNSWYRKWYSSFHSSWERADSCFLDIKQSNFLQSFVYFFLNPHHRYSL